MAKLMDTVSTPPRKEVSIKESGFKICKLVKAKKAGQIIPTSRARIKTGRNMERASLIGRMDLVTPVISLRTRLKAKAPTLGAKDEYTLANGRTT